MFGWKEQVTAPKGHAGGFSMAISKTFAAPLSALYQATAGAARRKKWFPGGTFQLSSQTSDKYVRGAWNGNARLEVGFYVKGSGKAQIAIRVGKLATRADIERERATWKEALDKLQHLVPRAAARG
jgi:hypothetical protein